MALDYFIAANHKEITGDALVAPQAPARGAECRTLR